MKVLSGIQQGTKEWLAVRAQHFCASDAAAAMGVSKYTKRNELLKKKATGIAEEITPEKQRLFDAGHSAEGAALIIAEGIASVEFYPAVGVNEVEGLALLASFDGIDMTETVVWENKLLSISLADQIKVGELDPHYWAQLEHQLLVSGASKTLFTASDGTPEGTRHLWYVSVPARRAQLIAAWKQVRADVLDYKPAVTVITAVAEVQTLPAVSVQVNGSIAIASNLPAFSVALKEFIGRIDMKPSTDQAFAEAEAAVKTLEKAQEALEAAKASGLAQVATVDDMVRMVDSLAQLARSTRLALDKMVKGRKDEIRAEIAQTARAAYTTHLTAQHQKLKGRVALTLATPDFAGAMKGKKTIASLRSAVDDLLAKAKIESSQLADDYAANIATIDEIAKNHQFLIRHLADLVTINPEHVKAVLQGRIDAYEKAEAQRRIEERELIRKEEEAKARREADKKAEAAREIREEERAKAREEVKTALAPEPKGADGLPASTPRIYADEPTPALGQPERVAVQPAKPILADIGKPRAPVRVSRPTDEAIVHLIATTYQVSAATALGWLREMNLETAGAI